MSNPGIFHVENDIIKSAEDKRSYKGLKLTNGMKVLFVHDPTTEKAAAAMDVHIGRTVTATLWPICSRNVPVVFV